MELCEGIKVQKVVINESLLEFETGIVIGLTMFKDLYSHNAKFEVGIFEDENLEPIHAYQFEAVDTYLNEEKLYDLYHDEVIPFLSRKYKCKKFFFDTWDLIEIDEEEL
ncbi:hypothetical protein [Lederbergia citri]|uniref:Uncharacterized protein n=1 Tax=Lederbergia citri TaxID=2833580 RepID=A0A942YHE1_9BACI|nr:hypothetical protein [Lederbergia citri]MBS4194346.1 hypothetical protein [Lederbergia citri]